MPLSLGPSGCCLSVKKKKVCAVFCVYFFKRNISVLFLQISLTHACLSFKLFFFLNLKFIFLCLPLYFFFFERMYFELVILLLLISFCLGSDTPVSKILFSIKTI